MQLKTDFIVEGIKGTFRHVFDVNVTNLDDARNPKKIGEGYLMAILNLIPTMSTGDEDLRDDWIKTSDGFMIRKDRIVGFTPVELTTVTAPKEVKRLDPQIEVQKKTDVKKKRKK